MALIGGGLDFYVCDGGPYCRANSAKTQQRDYAELLSSQVAPHEATFSSQVRMYCYVFFLF